VPYKLNYNIYESKKKLYFSFKVPNGNHPIYEIYEDSYFNNIEAKKWRVEEDKINS
jgi:hypothetical protein